MLNFMSFSILTASLAANIGKAEIYILSEEIFLFLLLIGSLDG